MLTSGGIESANSIAQAANWPSWRVGRIRGFAAGRPENYLRQVRMLSIETMVIQRGEVRSAMTWQALGG